MTHTKCLHYLKLQAKRIVGKQTHKGEMHGYSSTQSPSFYLGILRSRSHYDWITLMIILIYIIGAGLIGIGLGEIAMFVLNESFK